MPAHISALSLDEVNDRIRALYGEQTEHDGIVSPMLKIIARRPEFVGAYQAAFRARSAVNWPDPAEHGLPFLMSLKSASNDHSPYAVQWLRQDNENNPRITAAQFDAALRPHKDSPLFSEAEHLVLDFADAIATSLVDEALWTRLREAFSEAEIVDLVVVASIEAFFATFTKTVGLTSLDVGASLDQSLS
ncbi:MAG: hypothetical protein ABI743_15250 [bacterium]